MSKFVAAIFEDQEQARQGKHVLLSLDRDRTISVYSFSLVARDVTGRLTVIEPAAPGLGDAIPALISELANLVNGLPSAVGLLTDLGSWEDLIDFGVTPDFLQKIAAKLGPGKAAVLAEIEEDWITPLDTRIEGMGGVVLRTWRSDFEAEQFAKEARPSPNGAAKGRWS
jgi:uncharacterized membrane protein